MLLGAPARPDPLGGSDDIHHGAAHDRLAALRHSAYRIRRNALEMGEVQGQGYVGQALGVADVLAVVYMDQLRYRRDPHWEGRDRFLLSIGHYAIALWQARRGGDHPGRRVADLRLGWQPAPHVRMASYTPGMEISGGSLGHGLTVATGMALGLRYRATTPRCWPALRRRAERRLHLGGRPGLRALRLGQPDRDC